MRDMRVPAAGVAREAGLWQARALGWSAPAWVAAIGGTGRWAAVLAALAVAALPLWWHLRLVPAGREGIIAVFGEVGVYPADLCLALLAGLALGQPLGLAHVGRRLAARDDRAGQRPALGLDRAGRRLARGLAVLAAVVLSSALVAPRPALAAGLAGHLALLGLGWLAVRASGISRTALVGGLVGSAGLQAGLAVAQFTLQQPLVPAALHLPWLPVDVALGGTPVVLSASGDRLLRGFGTFPHPNVLGGYLALALVSLPLLGRRWPRWEAAWWSLGVLLGLGLLACCSRAGWLAASLGLGVWWWSSARQGHARWWPLLASAVALVALAGSPAGPTLGARVLPFGAAANPLERGSIGNRLALDRDALPLIGQHLPFGTGGGNYGLLAVAEGYQEGWGEPAPNVLLLVAAELGLPGIAALALLVWGMLGTLRTDGRLDVAATAACLALVCLAMLDHYLWTMPPGRVLAWLPLALVAARPVAGQPAAGATT